MKDDLKIVKDCKNPSNDDDLKILNVEYLSNHLLDHTPILNAQIKDNLQWKTTSKYKK